VIRVVLADDQPIVRSGLRMILDNQDDIEVVGEAADGRAALELARSADPDVIVMDLRMPVLDGIAATAEIVRQRLRARVVMLTTYGVDANVHAALRAGASGFFVKTDEPAELVAAVRSVASDDHVLSPRVVSRLVELFVTGPPPQSAMAEPPAGLTQRELEVLRLVGRGLSNTEIGEALFVSEGTVKTHMNRILAKLQLRDRVQVVVYCYEHGIVRLGEA
jgi:DNA-binding NarL/FixJ family response regulator